MAGLIDVLTLAERRFCEIAGRAALDAALARLSEDVRSDVWRSIRRGYIQPTAGVDAEPTETPAAKVGPATP